MNEKTIYDLKLHESVSVKERNDSGLYISDWSIVRVPGGWIYTDRLGSESPVFIPFNNEFMEVKK